MDFSGILSSLAQTGLSFLSKKQSDKNSRAEADAIVQEGNIIAANKARETSIKAASATVSFLNAGLTLDGSPQAAISGIYSTGMADVNQIIANTNAKSKNIYTAARTKYIQSLAKNTDNFGLNGLVTGDTDIGGSISGLFPDGSMMNPISWNQAPIPGSPDNPITWNE